MNETVEIVCPLCGRRQTVERWFWEFSNHKDERGNRDTHPLTCGGPDCPSHTEMVLVEGESP